MSDARIDEQAAAETLDADKLNEQFPPDHLMGVNQYGVTASEELVDEPLQERISREQPEPTVPAGDAEDLTVGTLVDTDEGAGPDLEKDAVASERRTQPFRSGDHRDAGDIAIGDDDLRDVGTERVDDMTGEEAAMHLTDAPPMHDTDGYLDES